MAKSLRSRRIKVNKRALKEKVFAPVENARTQRLSAKLQQLAAEPKPPKDTEMAETMPGRVLSSDRSPIITDVVW